MPMTNHIHGGDILTARQQFDGEILDFSANINPLGMPKEVYEAVAKAIANAVHYPDPLCRELAQGIAERDGVKPEQIICGNGAADLIFRLVFALRPKEAMVTAPSFAEYEQALDAGGCKVHRHLLLRENKFALTEAIIDSLSPELDMLFLCNPNNPTGSQIEADLLKRILDRCGELNILLVLDECFLELSDNGNTSGMATMLNAYSNLLILRAFTKSYAVPGLRLGYCLSSNSELITKLARAGQPWSVSSPAQAAGLAALRCPEHPAVARELIRTEREYLKREFEALHLTVFPSTANYLLFCTEGIGNLKERLISRGILIRSCANYAGLDKNYYRIAVRQHSENKRLIEAMRKEFTDYED